MEQETKKVFIKANTSEDYLNSLLEMLGMPSKAVQASIKNHKFLQYLKQNEGRIKKKHWA